MSISTEKIKNSVLKASKKRNESSFDDVWKYLCKVFEIKEEKISHPEKLIRRSDMLMEVLSQNGYRHLPSMYETNISPSEEIYYISLVGITLSKQITKAN